MRFCKSHRLRDILTVSERHLCPRRDIFKVTLARTHGGEPKLSFSLTDGPRLRPDCFPPPLHPHLLAQVYLESSSRCDALAEVVEKSGQSFLASFDVSLAGLSEVTMGVDSYFLCVCLKLK